MEPTPTFRLIVLEDPSMVGRTAASADLAKLSLNDMPRSQRLGLERTDWAENFGKPKPVRTVLIEAEAQPGDWSAV